MKLLLVVTGMPDVNGHGASEFNLHYVLALRKAGLEVTVVHLRSFRPGRAVLSKRLVGDVECYSVSAFFNMPVLGKIIFLESLFKRLIRKLGATYDLVHAVGGATAVAAQISAASMRTPFVIQFIGSDVNLELPNLLKLKSFQRSIKNAHMLCFNSTALLKRFDEQHDLSRYPTRVSRRGAPLSSLQFKFELSSETVFLYLGGAPNGNSKGGWTLIQAISTVASRAFPGKLVFFIAGPGSQTLETLPMNTNGNIECKFLGVLSRKEVLEMYAKSHVVLIPSLNEGLPNVLYEAMATGNMVIASDVGGISEVLQDGETGVLVQPNDASALAQAIWSAAMGGSDRIRRFAERGRVRVAEYSYDKFIDSYLDLYRTACAEGNS